MIQLPGGIVAAGRRQRTAVFKPVTGAVELALTEAGRGDGGRPEAVTRALSAALAQLGGEPPDHARVMDLCVGDRHFLMRRLAIALAGDALWFSHICRNCREAFDLEVVQSRLPVKPAGDGYPLATVTTSRGTFRFHVPTGRDQQAVAAMDDDRAALVRLAVCCLTDPADAAAADNAFSETDLDVIESALDQVAPQVATQVEAACPECGTTNRVTVDPCGVLGRLGGGLFQEIHQLAATYHWSEDDILALPRERRRRYLSLIDRARGMAS